jgi:hypothetical protein
MADIRIFRLQKIAFLLPGKFIIIAANGQAVVAGTHDLVLIIHDTGANLCVGVLAAAGTQQRHPHKVFIPRNIVLSLFQNG